MTEAALRSRLFLFCCRDARIKNIPFRLDESVFGADVADFSVLCFWAQREFLITRQMRVCMVLHSETAGRYFENVA